VPLGAFLLIHVAINATVLWGPIPLEQAASALHSLPALWLVEVLFVYAPLAIHTGVGLWLVLVRAQPVSPRPYPRAVRVAVRATGVATAVFVAVHVFEFRFRDLGLRLDGAELQTLLAADLSSTSRGLPWHGAAYLVGTACVSFHFAAGVWGVMASAGRSARRWAGPALGALGGLLWMTFVAVVVFHATGARPFRPLPAEAAAIGPCPVPAR
jgi:succinate dehydrogenase cytochrome b subunit